MQGSTITNLIIFFRENVVRRYVSAEVVIDVQRLSVGPGMSRALADA